MMNAHKVEAMARLACLRVSPQEATQLAQDLQQVFAWVEAVEQVACSPEFEVPPLPAHELRPDVVTEHIAVEDIVGQAPQRDGDFFTVPHAMTF